MAGSTSVRDVDDDGAARVYDPIVQGEAGVDLQGVFLKDYQPSPW